MASSEDHRLLNHQSIPSASILYAEIDSSQALNNSADSYSSSVINTSVIDLNKPTATLDSSSLAWNPNEHPNRLPENKSANVDLSHTPRLPHLPTTSSPQHFPALHSIPGCISNQNTQPNGSPLSHTTDTHNPIPPTQSHRPTGPQPNHQLETLSSVQPQLGTSSNSNPPLKKNGKPLAQCPYCGMTFKKLEHCQRHERTHTLARPYHCTVCSKTFARQDTLNRHLRLHSRSEGRVAVNKSSSQTHEAHASTSSPGSLKSPPRKLLSSPTGPSTDLLTLTGFLPSPYASPSHLRRQAARERGLSLSALEHSSFPGHLVQDVSMISNGPRQSISLPLQRPHQSHLPRPFQFNQNRTNPSHISSQQPLSSTLCVNGETGLPTEVRRGSWCPGVQNVNEFATLPTNDPIPSRSIPSLNPLALQPSLGMDNWESNLTTTFGLVETGIGPVPLSAPATCTKWSALGIESAGNGSSYAATSSSVIPAWDSPSQLDIQSQNKLHWPALGRLEEEDQVKPEPEHSNCNTCQVILSSPSQPDLFERPNSIDPNCLTGSSNSIIDAAELDTHTSLWSFPSGHRGQSSSKVQASLHPIKSIHKDMAKCFGDHWNTPQKQTVEIFNPVMWHPPACHNGPEVAEKVLSDSSFSTSNSVPINSTWENNEWEEMFELGF